MLLDQLGPQGGIGDLAVTKLGESDTRNGGVDWLEVCLSAALAVQLHANVSGMLAPVSL